MNNTKVYTAQKLRDMAENITRVDVMDGLTCREHCYPVKQEVKSMLRYAADMVERCDNVLKANARELEYRHKDADAALAYVNYILRGDTGKEENA